MLRLADAAKNSVQVLPVKYASGGQQNSNSTTAGNMLKSLMLALALLCSPAAVFAQGLPPDSLFPRLVGNWVLRGTIAGRQTVHDVDFEWLLGREYVQMHEVSRERAPNGSPAYEAVVVFGRDPGTGAYACVWMDNTAAAAFPPEGTGRGTVTGDSISFLFQYTPTTSFHTTFLYELEDLIRIPALRRKPTIEIAHDNSQTIPHVPGQPRASRTGSLLRDAS